MGLSRAFVQAPVAPTAFPRNATITDATLSTSSEIFLPDRPGNNRRGFMIENDGTMPMVFAYGSTVTLGARTFRLEPNDGFSDDVNWQGSVAAMSIGGAGRANFTEITLI